MNGLREPRAGAAGQGRAPRRLSRDRRGATAVEFGFVALAFILLTMGTVELARYYFTLQSLRLLTGEVARAALVAVNQGLSVTSFNNTTNSTQYTNCSGLSNSVAALSNSTQTALLQRVPILNPARLSTGNNAAWGNSATVTCTSPTKVSVSLSYRFNFIVPFLPSGNLVLNDQTTLAFR